MKLCVELGLGYLGDGDLGTGQLAGMAPLSLISSLVVPEAPRFLHYLS